MPLQVSERKRNKFNEVFSSANRFLVLDKGAKNPFVEKGRLPEDSIAAAKTKRVESPLQSSKG